MTNIKHRAACLVVLLPAMHMTLHAADRRPVHVVPNFHPASCGWLTDWSTERNYCANSYFDHLDRVRDDANYRFALSECNNLIAMLNFRPDRVAELKQRLGEGRAELCNAFFLEPTVNLSGGEALVKCGVEGLRWQQAVLGVRPRMAWMIDVTGTHEQMAQITDGLGLDALVYCRHNPTGYSLHWIESPDGTRTLAVSPGHYNEWVPVFKSAKPLDEKALKVLADDLAFRADPAQLTPEEIRARERPHGGVPQRTPAGAPPLVLAGSGDYSLAPACREYPTTFLEQMKKAAPSFDLRFAVPSSYLDAVLPGARSGAIPLKTLRGGTAYSYNAFWIQNPRVKHLFRRCEQDLQASEMLATAASLSAGGDYPVQPLHHAWLLMCLNMDRNTLWGAAGGMVFEHPESWDARDRFEWVAKTTRDTSVAATRKLLGAGDRVALFNPLNWDREDPVEIEGAGLCRPRLPSAGFGGAAEVERPAACPFAPEIETKHYRLRIDPETGALVSLRLKPSNREMLGGPANVIVAERQKKASSNTGDHMANREDRQAFAVSSTNRPAISVRRGALTTTVEIRSEFLGRPMVRTVRCYQDYPRIDFVTELNDVPDPTVVLADFPLVSDIAEVRRGVPYGFSHGAWAATNAALHGWTRGIVPAVRWSHYALAGGGGVALLDRGLTGRELVGRTAAIFLLNTSTTYRGYPNAWLSGRGTHRLEYALVAHDGPWEAARIPHRAWEYNVPPVAVSGCAAPETRSFLKTGDNVIAEALRREAGEIEVRLAECLGRGGEAFVRLDLPHRNAALTDLVGGRRQALAGGPEYRFAVRPQQIVTLRFRTDGAVPAVKPLTEWDELVPESKRAALRRYLPDVKGHPPAGGS